jgi:hypothetical protein
MKESLGNKPIKRTAKMNIFQLLNKYKKTLQRPEYKFPLNNSLNKMFLRQPAAAAAAQW